MEAAVNPDQLERSEHRCDDKQVKGSWTRHAKDTAGVMIVSPANPALPLRLPASALLRDPHVFRLTEWACDRAASPRRHVKGQDRGAGGRRHTWKRKKANGREHITPARMQRRVSDGEKSQGPRFVVNRNPRATHHK